MTTEAATLPVDCAEALIRLGVTGGVDPSAWRVCRVSGGVSCDVWSIDIGGRVLCAKRALAQLRVPGIWLAPMERSQWEARWLTMARRIAPAAAVELIGYDSRANLLVLEWLDASSYTNWKAQLLNGAVDMEVAAALGRTTGKLHSGAVEESRADWEPSRDLFEQLRIKPYFSATSRVHADLAGRLDDLAGQLRTASMTIVHGDLSPKNVMVGPSGPVLIDAECASPGDPAFDLAFCLTHLLLKSVHIRSRSAQLRTAAQRFAAAYRAQVDWEPPAHVDARAAALVPALLLARIDGLSPVDYLTGPDECDAVRQAARRRLVDVPASLQALIDGWKLP